MSDSPPWVSIRDFLTPPDILVVRTAGPKWNHAKLFGSFAALWFFLMEKDGSERGESEPLPEWPSPCWDLRQRYGLDSGRFGPGQLPDLTAPGSSGEWT